MPFGYLRETQPPHKPEQEEQRVLLMLPADSIRPNPYQPRRTFDEESLQELKQSIRETGLIQPLVVRKLAGRYELIAGERRLRACKMLGMREIPCIVQSCPEERDSALMALIENVQRRDLHFFEEAECYRAVLKTYHMTQESLAARLGKSQSFLANKLRLLQLSPAIRETMGTTRLTERHARALLQLPTDKLQQEALDQILQRELNVKDTERLVQRMLSAQQTPHRPILVRLLKDYRLFVNTVRFSADQLRSSGLCVELVQTDCDNGVDMLIRVRRPIPPIPAEKQEQTATV